MPLGPIYCETPSVITGFPVEPINTWSNLVIIALGLIALYVVWRRKPNASVGPYLLGAFLLLTGIGSFLWQGLRAEWALVLDTVPGVVCLFVVMYFWMRRFFSLTRVLLIMGGVLLLQVIAALLLMSVAQGGLLFAPLGIVVTGLGIWLIIRTRQVSPPASTIAVWTLVCAIAALIFRTIDATGIICPYIPFGTHFLWHIFLSIAAFLGVLVLLELDA